MHLYDRQILQLAVPSIVSNITVPLLGLIDVAIVGHMGDAVYIGAVAVGSMIFNLVYWLFAFLRMGTSGMTAQAYGRRDLREQPQILLRSMVVAMLIALALIGLQVPLRWLLFWLIGPTPDVAPLAARYFYIVVWGAPAMLGLYSLTGWFIGMQNTRIPMFISIMQNVVNIVASLLLVYGFGMKLEGVATGTVVAQYAGFFAALALLLRHYGRLLRKYGSRRVSSIASLFRVNRDIFLRTLCLVAVNMYFTAVGARHGAIILSVNTVILQLYLLFSYFMDGFAHAGEALSGRYYGARNGTAFRATLRRLFLWMAGVTALFTLAYALGGMWFIAQLTDEQPVVDAAREYIFWAWLIPAAGAVAFIWDGVFIGLTATRGMLVSSAIAAATFFAIYTLAARLLPTGTHASLLNHALWLAQIVYLAMRGLVQTVWYRRKIAKQL